MKKILLIMFRRIFTEALQNSLYTNKPDFILLTEYDYKRAVETTLRQQPDVVIVEAKEGVIPLNEDPFDICTNIRRSLPKCAIMLMCPENSVRGRRRAVAAMQAGDIDDYVFYSTSMDYLISKLETLTDLGLGVSHRTRKKSAITLVAE